jgi:MinD-like ATPase involved in chromosome partitioning or flagellar assembly
LETQRSDLEGAGAAPLGALFRTAEPDAVAHGAAQSGARGLLNRLGLRVQPGAAERRQRERAAALDAARAVILHSAFPRSIGVLVANPKGTSGKTPATLGLASAFAAVRGNGICALEVADDAGTLALRAEGTPQRDLGDLVRDIASIASSGQLSAYAVTQSSFVDVFGSRPGDARPALTAEDVVRVSAAIDVHYRWRFMDSGNVVTTGPFLGALEVADVLVVPVMMARDSGLKAIEMLDGLLAAGGHAADLARNAIILRMTDGRPENEADRDDVVRFLQERGGARQFDIPFDAHIAERRDITWAKVSPAVQDAFTFAAAEIVRVIRGDAPSVEASRPTTPEPSTPAESGRAALAPLPSAVQDGTSESTDAAGETPAPVSAVLAAREPVVPSVGDTREGWVVCPSCGQQTPEARWCAFCRHQLTDTVNLQRFYGRARRASGYAEPAEDLPEQLRGVPKPASDDDTTDPGTGRASA